jgi:hypothetical protein
MPSVENRLAVIAFIAIFVFLYISFIGLYQNDLRQTQFNNTTTANSTESQQYYSSIWDIFNFVSQIFYPTIFGDLGVFQFLFLILSTVLSVTGTYIILVYIRGI